MPHLNEMPYDALIREKLAAEPYASMADDVEVAAGLNAETVPGDPIPARNIGARDVRAALYAAGVWNDLYLLSLDAKTGEKAHDAAMASAHNIVAMAEAGETIATATPEVETIFLADLQAVSGWNGTINAAAIEAVQATYGPMPPPDIPWWKAVGSEAPLNDADVARARGAAEASADLAQALADPAIAGLSDADAAKALNARTLPNAEIDKSRLSIEAELIAKGNTDSVAKAASAEMTKVIQPREISLIRSLGLADLTADDVAKARGKV